MYRRGQSGILLVSRQAATFPSWHPEIADNGHEVKLPTPPALPEDDFEPEEILDKPVSEIILEDCV